jgi:hypothetical protein
MYSTTVFATPLISNENPLTYLNFLITNGHSLLALVTFINPKTGRRIFGCSHIFNPAAKVNQSKCPSAQNVVLVGLLKHIKDRRAWLPLAHQFSLPNEVIALPSDNMNI